MQIARPHKPGRDEHRYLNLLRPTMRLYHAYSQMSNCVLAR